MNKDIEKILADLRLTGERYAKPTRYYDGDHDLAFATQKFENAFGTLFREFALNLCPVICDAVRDKLKVVGFSADSFGVTELQSRGGGKAPNSETSANSVNSATRKIWHTNRMDTRAGEVHKEALKNGDAYIIVWPNARGEAVFYPNRAASISVVYDEDSPGLIRCAAKHWLDADKHVRLNLFYPDRIEKYISRGKSEGAMPDAKDFALMGQALPNPYSVVPVFHFANNSDIGQLGRSELEAAIPVQDGLNKSVLDMLVAMEFAAYRQRWAAGIEVEYDADGKTVAPFKAGIDHLWIANDPSARFGDFEAAQLEQFLKVKDGFRVDIASVTGTPLHYLLQNTGGFPSGESLKKAETRFLAKVRDRQTSFGQVWADVMEFALRIEGRKTARLITEWEDPAPMSEREVLENILLKKQIGLPVEQALLEAGYGEADVTEMVKSSVVE
ncbi:MAG: phage portal protein [Pyrinomonadaceae bacterium]